MKKIAFIATLVLVLALATVGFSKTDSTATGTKAVATAKVVKPAKKSHKKTHAVKAVKSVAKDTASKK